MLALAVPVGAAARPALAAGPGQLQVTIRSAGGGSADNAVAEVTLEHEAVRQPMTFMAADGTRSERPVDGMTVRRVAEVVGVDAATVTGIVVRDLSPVTTPRPPVALTGDEVAFGFPRDEVPGSMALINGTQSSGLDFVRPRRGSSDPNGADERHTVAGSDGVLGVEIDTTQPLLSVERPGSWPSAARVGETVTLAAPEVRRDGALVPDAELSWYFGDAPGQQATSGTHRFDRAGQFEARVIAVDPATGARGASTATLITVKAGGGGSATSPPGGSGGSAPPATSPAGGGGGGPSAGGGGDPTGAQAGGAAPQGRPAGSGPPRPGRGAPGSKPVTAPVPDGSRERPAAGREASSPDGRAGSTRGPAAGSPRGAAAPRGAATGSAAGTDAAGRSPDATPARSSSPARTAEAAATKATPGRTDARQDGGRRERAADPSGRPSPDAGGVEGVLLLGPGEAPVPAAAVVDAAAATAPAARADASDARDQDPGGWALGIVLVLALVGLGARRELEPRGRSRTLVP